MILISVTILTKNSARTLKRTLDSLKDFAEVLVYDTGSTDATLDIAKIFKNVKVYHANFEGFGPSHNKASSLANYDWILSIDSDEWLSEPLIQQIKDLNLDLESVYVVQRKNYFKKQWIWSCGWSPDWQKKLYNRKTTQFTPALVHETIDSQELKKIYLTSYLNHEPYQNIEHFLTKMQQYSSLFALQSAEKKASPLQAITHSLFAFFKSYFLKRGICQGYPGLLISLYNSQCAFYKYIKLYELHCGKQLPFDRASDRK
jgi:glycosyltransferase involved in cell wall biosynthesis